VPHEGGWEWNDLFGIFFALPSILLIKAGVDAGGTWMLPVGLGMTAYGAIYVIFHDIVVHRRVRIRNVPQWAYLRRIIMAHLVHHKTHAKDGAQSFGFLWAPKDLTK
jgi:beta-carotene 3-hydroxylase